MMQHASNKYFSATCLFLSGLLMGCDTQPTKNSPSNPLMINNAPADYRAIPEGFAVVSEDLVSRDLATPTADQNPGNNFRFTRITDSGISFSNFLDRKKAFQYIETGAGLALGDFDNDGLTDVYFCGTEIPNKLYRNKGNFQFEDVTFESGVDGRIQGNIPFASGASFADIDNDGDLDLYVCNMAGPNLLYVNQGDGTFNEQSRIRKAAYTGASKIANFCDYDQDGDLDFYLVTYQDKPSLERKMVSQRNGKPFIAAPYLEHVALMDGHQVRAGEKDLLFRNNGDGTFAEVSKSAGIEGHAMGLGSVWLDFDHDGWQDIYVTTDFKLSDRLYRNRGDGTFEDVLPKVARHTPWFSMGIDSGDLNNDGLVDLFTADMAGNNHYKQKVDMGSMSDVSWFLSRGAPRQYMKNAVLINSGAGPFLEAASMMGLSSTNWTWAVRLVDMDNDGKLDVYVTNGHARDIMNGDLAARFDEVKKTSASAQAWDEVYLSVPVRKEANLAFRNKGNLEFEAIAEAAGLDHEGVSHGAAFADLDNDGDLDLIVNNFYEQASIYRNDSDAGSRTLLEFRCLRNNFFGYGTKVEFWQGGEKQVKTLHPVRGYLSSDSPQLHFGAESNEPISKIKITWPDQTVQEFTDLEPNRLYRVFESQSAGPIPSENPIKPLFAESAARLGIDFVHRENDFDDYQREELLPYQLSMLSGCVSWGDANGDQWPDLFCGGAAGQSGQLFINQQGRAFKKSDGPWTDDSNHEDSASLFFDADGDGDQDLLVASGSTEKDPGDGFYRDRLYRNDGQGNFSRTDALPEMLQSTSCVACCDFDKDGDLDLFVGARSVPGKYPLTPRSFLLRNEQGQFGDATSELSDLIADVGLVTAATWADIDSDGWQDLIVACEWGSVKVFRNEQGESFTDQTEPLGIAAFTGWWHGVEVADLDGDGDLDLVATNQGLNTKYHADATHPHRLYYDDFDGNGTMDIVEAEFEGDVEFPVRGRSCSSHCMPFIKDKFETYHDFALASLHDIYEPTIKGRPYREVVSLENAIFWNDDGKFRHHPMPRLAQISPAYGLAIEDFDQDGVKDIVIANNFHAAQPETGYMDGGLGWLLKGNKDEGSKLRFDAVWPNNSGIVIDSPGTVVAAADFDRDGDIDVAMATNDGAVRLLVNQTKGANNE